MNSPILKITVSNFGLLLINGMGRGQLGESFGKLLERGLALMHSTDFLTVLTLMYVQIIICHKVKSALQLDQARYTYLPTFCD